MTDILDHYIDGAATAPQSKAYVDAFDPRTGKVSARVAGGTAADVDAAVRSAAAALPAWRARRPIERGRILNAIAQALRAESASLSALERRDTGKPAWQAPLEIEGAAQYFEFYAGLVNLYQGEKIDLGAGYHSYTSREPFGVVGVITPWNAPLNQAARAVAPALAAGNTVVLKPSEFTSGTSVALARIAVACGLPAGVLNVVLGTGPDCGTAVVSHPLVRKVAFTGSVRAGREIGRIAAERIIPLTLELGGKSPNIIFADADLGQAIPGAVRAFVVNAGQVCLAGSRLLVEQSIHQTVVDGLKQALAAVKVGPADDAMVGPLTTQAQYERVKAWFDAARAEGLEPVVGGTVLDPEACGGGWFVQPTVYDGVTNDMRIAREEVFGPVLSVIPFADEAEAIAIANDTDYGLAAGIWTQNLSRAHRVAAALEAGQVYVNEYQAGGVETPLGGFKMSGYGREKGIEALHHYTQLKCVTIKL
ncbi:aldehyde dehydrogenase family protein [Zavarzinia sp. CC-PAN008]|uniref:aldehyde dehydrogenase family protein n=1 Tax=Zavarzinia sp. CC-PAN008 TaxID=3243332 RepID=UPI003F746469